jgi:hypothetical protein
MFNCRINKSFMVGFVVCVVEDEGILTLSWWWDEVRPRTHRKVVSIDQSGETVFLWWRLVASAVACGEEADPSASLGMTVF